MFEVKYRCLYRDYWYADLDTDDWTQAVVRARVLSQERRGGPVVIMVGGRVVYRNIGGNEVLA
jgi:hypothetical protein